MKPFVPRAPYADRLRAHAALMDRGAGRIAAICADLGHIEAVYAFGSFATRAIRLRSDLDVLIVHDASVSHRECEANIRSAFDIPIYPQRVSGRRSLQRRFASMQPETA